MINIEQINENELSITWDKNSPTESILNTWTKEDFIRVIMEYVQKVEDDPTTSIE